MNKPIILLLLLVIISSFNLTAQDMSKQQTLDYILRIYRKVNRFYLSDATCMLIPVGIDSASLEYDQLIFYYKVPGDNYMYSGPRSATISGDLQLDEDDDGVKNADNDWVIRVQENNTAELKRLFYALQHLQNFIKTDPFAGQVNQYESNKRQEQAAEEQRAEERQREYELARHRQANEEARERQQETQRRRQAEERERQEEQRRGEEAVRKMQEMNRRSTGGG